MPPKRSNTRAKRASKRTTKTSTPTPMVHPQPRIRLNLKTNSQRIDPTNDREDDDSLSTSESSEESLPRPPPLPRSPSRVPSIPRSHAYAPATEENKAYVITIELRVFLDLEEVFSKEYRVDILDVFRKSYASFHGIIERQIDQHIEEQRYYGSKRIPRFWRTWYGAKGNPTESRIDGSSDFDETLEIIRARKLTWLLLQVAYGLSISPGNIPKPPFVRPKVADLDNEREAERGTFKEVITRIQIKWACNRRTCGNYTKFCWIYRDNHFMLSPQTLHRWATEIQANHDGASVDMPSGEVQTELLHPSQFSQVQERQANRRRDMLFETSTPLSAQYAPSHLPYTPLAPPPWASAPFQWSIASPWSSAYSAYPYPLPQSLPSIQQETSSWNSPTPYQPLVAPQYLLPNQPFSQPSNQTSAQLPPQEPILQTIRELGPIRPDIEIEEQLASFLQWLLQRLPSGRHQSIKYIIRTAEEQEWSVDQIKGLSVALAKAYKIPNGTLQLVQSEIRPFKKSLKSESNNNNT